MGIWDICRFIVISPLVICFIALDGPKILRGFALFCLLIVHRLNYQRVSCMGARNRNTRGVESQQRPKTTASNKENGTNKYRELRKIRPWSFQHNHQWWLIQSRNPHHWRCWFNGINPTNTYDLGIIFH